MAENAGELSFAFTADLTGLTRAAQDAGKTLDDFGRKAAAWSGDAATALTKPFDDAVGGSLRLSQGMAQAAATLRIPPARVTVAPLTPISASGSADDNLLRSSPEMTQAAEALRVPAAPVTLAPAASATNDNSAATKELSHLADQLALLQTTGAAHDAIVERMKIETDQAKLGTDVTDAQKQAVASLVEQIDAASAAQTRLASTQAASETALRSSSLTVSKGLESVILNGASLPDVGRSLLSSFARQGLDGALTGTGSFAGLFGTKGSGGQVGGLFGAIESLFGGGGLGPSGATQADAAALPNFAGLYANGGSIEAGQWGIVGEKGAEVVAGPATVVPMSRMATSAAAATQQTINFNVTSPDAPSFASSQDQMSALLSRLVSRGQRNA